MSIFRYVKLNLVKFLDKNLTSSKGHIFKSASIIVMLCLVLSSFVPINTTQAAQGNVKTTDLNCSTNNVNQYNIGETVWVKVSGFDENTSYNWTIIGQPGSSDSGSTVASGTAQTSADGSLCLNAGYVVLNGDSGEYKVNFGDKNDNYNVKVKSEAEDLDQCFKAPVTLVTPSSSQGWSSVAPLADTRSNGTVSFVSDATSPAPGGSLSLVTGAATGSPLQDKAQYMHAAASLPISEVNKLCYYTKQNSASFANGAPSYQLVVFLNGGTSGFTTFVYEPYNNGYNITPGSWQSWDVSAGTMWSTRNVTCTNGNVLAGAGGPPFYSLSQIATMCPNAVVAAFGVNVGSNNPNWDTQVEYVQFNNTIYNFEPDPVISPKTVTISKVWQDANGNAVPAPSNKTDISITATSTNPVSTTTCSYVGNDLQCTGTLTFLNGTINVVETGLPAGWATYSGTGTSEQPVCTDDSCTHTIVNRLLNPEPCGNNIIVNGGFEIPSVTNTDAWNVYASGTPGLGWSATWVDGTGAPAKANIELHRGVNGWNSKSGSQHTELDSDWAGPTSSQSGENASVRIFQDLNTVIGGKYNVSLWTSPRPGQGLTQNITEVKAGSNILGTITEDGTNNSNTVWTKHTYSFVATSNVTRFSIADMGLGDSLGGFLDDVSVVQDCVVEICKYDNKQNPLTGWEVFLKGEKVDTVTVSSTTGINYLSDSLPAGDYILEASGKYTYRPSDPAASESDAAYSKRLPSDSVYGGPDAPWVNVNTFPNPYTGWLGIQVNEMPFNWASSFNPFHKYANFYNLSTTGQIKFRILDDNYSDNSGSLTVDIYRVFKGVTGENGCVNINAPKGEYNLDEMMQEGWSNVSGQGLEVNVDGIKDNFTLVNKCDSGCESEVQVCKLNDKQKPLADWDVFLKGNLVETLSLNSANATGVSSVNTLETGKNYLVVVNGTWQNRGFETVDASFTTPDGWTTVLAAPQGGYPDDLLETQVNQAFVNWSSYNTGHEYSVLVIGNGSSANFRVYDFENDSAANSSSPNWFGDNNGTLTVKIYEVYQGKTGKNGCVTIENVPFGNYMLGEIMQPGWVNQDGLNDTVNIDTQNEGPFNLVNKCTTKECEEPIDPKLHFVKVVCSSFSDINGNELADQYDATPDGNYTEFANYNDGTFTTNYLVNGVVSPSELPSESDKNCKIVDGWQFLVSTEQNMDGNNQTFTTTDGEYTTNLSALTPELQTGIRNGNFWVKEIEQQGYDFATLRCYDDALNGDNLEVINIGNESPQDIYCIAYNVKEIQPCVSEPISVYSSTATQFLGLVEGSEPANLNNPGNYPNGTMGFAVPVSPTGYAGAWDGAINDPNLSGSMYVSNNSTQPTFSGAPGFNGSVDSWRLFSQTFTIPAGAVNISMPSLHFAADNKVSVYLDEALIGTSTSFNSVTTVGPLSLTSGSHTLKFAVQNYAFDQTNNPTGVIYKLDTINYDCSTNGGGSKKYSISGYVYEDLDESNSYEEGDNPLSGWEVELDNLATEGENSITTSNGEGYYIFDNLDAGCYIVTENMPNGWAHTQPNVSTYAYQVAIGGSDNCDIYNEEEAFTSLFIRTAHAASGHAQLGFIANATNVNFGNFDIPSGGGGGSTSGGGSGGSGGSGGGGPAPTGTPTTGQVLGDTTTIPSVTTKPNPQVLGANTTLPRTGLPLNIFLWFIAALAASYCVYHVGKTQLKKNSQ